MMSTPSSTPKPTVAITSSDGRIAAAVLYYLEDHAHDLMGEIRLICQDEEKVNKWIKQSSKLPLKTFVADPNNHETMADIMNGCELVLLIPPAHGDVIKSFKALVMAAEKTHINGAVLVSWTHTNMEGMEQTVCLKQLDMMEKQFMKCDSIPHKLLVHVSLYMEILKYFANPLAHHGELPLPVKPSANVAPIDSKSTGKALGTIVMQWFSQPGRFGNQTLMFTGPTLVNPHDLAAELSRVGGRNTTGFKYNRISMDQAREIVAKSNVCKHSTEIDALMDALMLWNKGDLQFVSSDIKKVLGLDPLSVGQGLELVFPQLLKVSENIK